MLRKLLFGWCLWGATSAVHLTELVLMGGAAPAAVMRALIRLRAEGLVSIDRQRGLVALTGSALEQLAVTTPPAPPQSRHA
ncbi:MAG: hypothetical protein A3J75_08240 [Acidobacteria bacterium RBG_16_68_9]|nr:MAG: hypothetical protein A3J75_08240 [Acidobacteria bacterium RBG_16_68_9]